MNEKGKECMKNHPEKALIDIKTPKSSVYKRVQYDRLRNRYLLTDYDGHIWIAILSL